MKVAYFVNQYPKVSHTFVRREILALESQGWTVTRHALRGWDAEVRDPADEDERLRTRYLLQQGLTPLLWAALGTLLASPAAFLRGIAQACRLARRSERAWPYHLVYLAEACALRQRLAEEGVSHVHAHFGTNSAEVVMLCHAVGGPGYSFTVHGPEEFDAPQALALADKVRASRFTVAISDFGRSQLLRWLTADQWHKVRVVHCGLDALFTRQTPLPAPDRPRLVCVGRLCEQKGQLLLVQALALLRDRGVRAELVLAGDGEMRAAVEQEIARFDLAAQVRITGWIDSMQVRDEVLASRALVLPSFAEGLPVVLMEAMALARPVLSTYVAGIPELVRHGVDGWLFPAGSVAAAADAMQTCLETPLARIHAMGVSGRERALARHDVQTEAARLAQAFAEAMREGMAC